MRNLLNLLQRRACMVKEYEKLLLRKTDHGDLAADLNV